MKTIATEATERSNPAEDALRLVIDTTNQANAAPMRPELAYESERCSEQRYGYRNRNRRFRK